MAMPDRPDMEIIAMLHVHRKWFVRLATASHAASTLSLALRIARSQRGNQLTGIESADRRHSLSPHQIERLQIRLASVRR